MKEAPTEGKVDINKRFQESHELQANGRELWQFVHSYEKKKKWARLEETIGEGNEKGYNKNCA